MRAAAHQARASAHGDGEHQSPLLLQSAKRDA
jgi:hypothetical protein